jgi:hypothetical protein
MAQKQIIPFRFPLIDTISYTDPVTPPPAIENRPNFLCQLGTFLFSFLVLATAVSIVLVFG